MKNEKVLRIILNGLSWFVLGVGLYYVVIKGIEIPHMLLLVIGIVGILIGQKVKRNKRVDNM